MPLKESGDFPGTVEGSFLEDHEVGFIPQYPSVGALILLTNYWGI